MNDVHSHRLRSPRCELRLQRCEKRFVSPGDANCAYTPFVTDDRSRLDVLQGLLQSRKSVFHFAHAAVSLLIATIAACTGAKLFWDYEFDEMPTTGAVLGLSFVLFIYGCVNWVLGRRTLKTELTLFSELKGLRTSLGFDDPAALLPR